MEGEKYMYGIYTARHQVERENCVEGRFPQCVLELTIQDVSRVTYAGL